MTPVVIDTNVLLVANGRHETASSACRAECIARLQSRKKAGVVVVDDGYRIILEYHKKTRPHQPKGVGDLFLKWLMQNISNQRRVHVVKIMESLQNHFEEFPDKTLQANFDSSDRVFVAVAHAHTKKPPIWQATDSKWLAWWPQLHACGVKVEFLCPEDVQQTYIAKFPKRPAPLLPNNI